MSRPSALGRWVVVLGVCVAVVVVLTAAEYAVADWLRAAGVGVIGDQPAYLTQAQTLLSGSVHPLATFEGDLARHYFSAFSPGAKPTDPGVFEAFNGPKGIVSPFEPGLAALLAPFLAIGGQAGAFVGFFALEIAGLVFVHQRASRLCGLRWRAQVLLGVAFAAPSVVVAGTQLYPDLISGIVLAAALVELAGYEMGGRVGRTGARRGSAVTIAVAVAVLPWLQIKNVVPGLVVLAAFAIVSWRHRRPGWRAPSGRVAVVVGAVVVISWGCLLAYNLRTFGHVLGLPEPAPAWDRASMMRTTALLFDRDQGLFVQLPTAMLGVIGLARIASRISWTALGALGAVAAVLVLNGTYGRDPFGGTTLSGRFEWTIMPVAVAFGAFALAHWQEHGRALLRASAVLVVAWGLQASVLVGYRHTDRYFTMPAPWDPAAYPAWWPGFGHLLPAFVTVPHRLGAIVVGVVLVVALSLALVWIPALPRPLRSLHQPTVLFAGAGLLALSAMMLAAAPGDALPSTVHYAGGVLGSPVSAGTHAVTGREAVLQGIVPGTYRFTATYSSPGTGAPAVLVASCDATPSGGTELAVRRVELAGQAGTASVEIACAHSGSIAARLSVPEGEAVTIDDLALSKL